MTEKQLCRDCIHLEHDGFAGIWCGVHGNNRNYDCKKYEKKGERMTENKRFWINTLTEYIGINDKDKLLTFDEVADLLNGLLEGKKKIHFQCDLLQEQANEYHRAARENANMVGQLKRENKELKYKLRNCEDARKSYKQDWKACSSYCDEYKNKIISLKDDVEGLIEENKELKQELKDYHNAFDCSQCKYQNYDWFDDGDEFEVCDKGNNEAQMYNHSCKQWEEL